MASDQWLFTLELPDDVYSRLLRSAEFNRRTLAEEIANLINRQFDRDYSKAEFDKLVQEIMQGHEENWRPGQFSCVVLQPGIWEGLGDKAKIEGSRKELVLFLDGTGLVQGHSRVIEGTPIEDGSTFRDGACADPSFRIWTKCPNPALFCISSPFVKELTAQEARKAS